LIAGDSARIAMSTSSRIAYCGSCSNVRWLPRWMAALNRRCSIGRPVPNTRRSGDEATTVSPIATATSTRASAALASFSSAAVSIACTQAIAEIEYR